MKIFIGSDHRGFDLKSSIKDYLTKSSIEFSDDGDSQPDADDDFDVFAAQVVHAMQGSDDPDAKGILICGSGQGMCIAANRFKGIRACLAWDNASAQVSRNDDDCNVVCLPASILSRDQAISIIQVWLSTPFANSPRFTRRIKALDELN